MSNKYLKTWQENNMDKPINHKAVVGIIINEKNMGRRVNAEQARNICPTWRDYANYKSKHTPKQATNTLNIPKEVIELAVNRVLSELVG